MLKRTGLYTIVVHEAVQTVSGVEKALSGLNGPQQAVTMFLGLLLLVLAGTFLEAVWRCLFHLLLRAIIRLLISIPEVVLNKLITKAVEALILFGLAILAGVSWLNSAVEYVRVLMQ